MYIYACVYVFVHLCVYTHVYVYVYAYLCIDCGSWYQCRRILFICTVQSLYYMRVYHRCFLTLACVCVGGLEVGLFQLVHS